MAMASLFLVLFLLFGPSAATLNIIPNRSQFFRYEQFNLTCAGSETVKRSTSSSKFESCEGGFGVQHEASCIVKDIYPSDSGVYWCESKEGKKSNNINITVTNGSVILESPAVPVTKGYGVTLRCLYKKRYEQKYTSEFSASFYRDGVFIGTETQGIKTLKAQEGFYKCQNPKKGDSPQSWLAVTSESSPDGMHVMGDHHFSVDTMTMDGLENRPLTSWLPGPVPDKSELLRAVKSPPPPPPQYLLPMSLTTILCITLVFILYTVIIIVSVYAYRRWTRARAERRIYEHLVVES